EVPTASVTVAVSLADELDTLASFFSIDERPTGSKDPFALPRAALGVVRLVLTNRLRFSIRDASYTACMMRVADAKPDRNQSSNVEWQKLDLECDPNLVYEALPDF